MQKPAEGSVGAGYGGRERYCRGRRAHVSVGFQAVCLQFSIILVGPHVNRVRLPVLGKLWEHHPHANWDTPESIKRYDMDIFRERDLPKSSLFMVPFFSII